MAGYSKNTLTLFELDFYEWLFPKSPSKQRKKNTKASLGLWEVLGRRPF